MALKSKISASEHAALSSELQKEYKPDGDMFVLDVEGLGDVGQLTKALNSERENSRKVQQELAKLRDTYKDIEDPEKAREALKKIHDLEEQSLMSAGKLEEVVSKRTEALRKDAENREAQYKKQLERAKAETDALNSRLAEEVIDRTLRDAFTKTGGRATAVEDVILRGRQIFRMKDGRPVPMRGDEVIYGKDAGSPMSPEEWVSSLTTSAPHLFEASSGSGAENKNRAGSGGYTLTREQARNPQTYQAAKERAAKAGQELVIAQQ